MAGRLAPALLLAGLVACGGGATPTPPPECPDAAPSADEAASIISGADQAVVVTSKGEFTVDLTSQSAPIAVANFVALAQCGFYDGVTFHRVLPGFVAQAGDPQTRDNRADFQGLGTGGPGYRFEIELPPDDTVYRQYAVAMANAMQYDPTTGEIQGGTDTNGSQFFVMLADAPSLRPYYSLLGQVESGRDVVDAIGEVPTNGERGVPLDPVIIETIRIEGQAEAS